jgi:spermidine synthase
MVSVSGVATSSAGRALRGFGLALLLLAAGAARDGAGVPRIVFDQPSPYARVLVIDEGRRRYLRFDRVDGDDQSMIDLDDPRAVPMDYVRHMAAGLVHVERPRSLLMVGLGGGTFTMLLHRMLPELHMDVVDIDPVVVQAAKAHFGVIEDARHRIHLGDGRAFVEADRTPRDLIVLDAYSGDGIPRHLTTIEFFSSVRAHLAPGGAVVANVAAADPDEERALLASFAAVFPATACYRAVQSANVILVGTSDDTLPPLPARMKRATQLDVDLRLPFALAAVVSHADAGCLDEVRGVAPRHDAARAPATAPASRPAP